MKDNAELFNEYADSYKEQIRKANSIINKDSEFFTYVKARKILTFKQKLKNVTDPKVLDVGCGIGLTDTMLATDYSNLYGIDVSQESIKNAQITNPSVNYSVYEGKKLPYNDNYFDIVFTINVMHHVSHDLHKNFLSEMIRVLKPGGIISVFEHNPLNPLTRKSVRECPFDEGVILLKNNYLKRLFVESGLKKIQNQYILFFPFKNELFRKIEDKIWWCPLGAQYFMVGEK